MASITFEGIKYSYNQRQAGIVIAFVVHPENMPDYVALAPLGSRVMITLTEIGDDEKPIEQPKPEKPKQSWSSMSRAQQAGILCNDRNFANWLGYIDYETHGTWVGYAIGRVYAECGISSRSELDVTRDKADNWDSLVSRYRTATGQQAWRP
jgi:hypothetical protein